jgi:hypothetical protein
VLIEYLFLSVNENDTTNLSSSIASLRGEIFGMSLLINVIPVRFVNKKYYDPLPIETLVNIISSLSGSLTKGNLYDS